MPTGVKKRTGTKGVPNGDNLSGVDTLGTGLNGTVPDAVPKVYVCT